MASHTPSADQPRAAFVDVDLSGARFLRVDLSDAVMRAVHIRGADIDAPWLLDGESSLLVNGVDVVPYVEAELDRRFPGRAERRARDPETLRAAWTALERAWAATCARVETMPPGTVDASVSVSARVCHPVTSWIPWNCCSSVPRSVRTSMKKKHATASPNEARNR